MAKAAATPEDVEEQFEDDPELRKLFKSYLRETLDEYFAESEEDVNDGSTGPGTGTGGTEAGKARAETSDPKTKQLRSIFARK